MKRHKEWFETFFAGLYGHVLANQFTEEESQKQARTVRRALGLKKGSRVLDIPCGMGRLTLPLARMGMEMTGVDLQEGYIRRAKRDARKAGVGIRYVARDMREIDFDGEFDAAVNWFTSFGYFSDEDNVLFLRKAFRALAPGGKLLIETMNKSSLLANWRGRGDDVRGGLRIVTSARFDRRANRVIDVWTIHKGGQKETGKVVIRVFDAPSMRRILRQAGFRGVRLYGEERLGGRVGRLTRHSRRMIAVATRPKE